MSERAEWAKERVVVLPEPSWGRPIETQELLRRDTCRRFHDLMDNAMLISAMKYGPVENAYPDKVRAVAITAAEGKKYDASLEQRLRLYRETGNVEYLVDVANFAMIEFMHPRHPKAHYKHEGDGSIGRSTIAGLNQMNNKDLTTIANG